MKGYVYHIKNPANLSLEDGYIGVVKKEKGVYKRFLEHKTCKDRIMHHHIRTNEIEFEHIEILFEGDIQDCYKFENKLRPSQNIGWNLATGGGGPYNRATEDLIKFRSEHQKMRMQDKELKIQQGAKFKENYYQNEEAQILRKLRAKEHMADPDKKQKCLSVIHKKIKCPHCEFVSNVGNVKQHIRKKHNEI